MTTLLVLLVAAVLSATISGLVGMAGGVTLMASMVLVLPFPLIVPLHGVAQLVSNFSRTWILRSFVKRVAFLPFALGSPLGAFLAYSLLARIKIEEWGLIFIIGLLLYVALKPKKAPEIKLNRLGFLVLGVIAALLGPLLGATGPFLASFFVRDDYTKEQLVATKAACQIMIHLYKIPIFLALDFDYSQHSDKIVCLVVGVIIGTRLGTWMLTRIDPRRFGVLLKTVLVIIAIKLTLDLVQSPWFDYITHQFNLNG